MPPSSSADPTRGPVAVIIPAHNAATTIALPIMTALREPEVAEVMIVDDASTDDTYAVATASDDGSGRLSVVRLDQNVGPSFARNVALERTSAPFVAVLDADDFFVAGRMGRMLAHTEWDLIADNVAFIFGEPTEVDGLPTLPQFQTEPEYLDLPRFVEGNISRPNSRRGELGFLKPVMSRAFLDQHGLRYDETLRLGEDYALYVRALAHGARFKVIKSCGYGAVVHATSLSSRHSAGDLAALANSDLELLVNGKLDGPSRAALLLHERHVRDRYRFRNFLDIKAARGVLPALSYGLGSQANVSPIATALFRARARWLASRLRHQAAETIPDFLLPGHVEAEPAEGSQ